MQEASLLRPRHHMRVLSAFSWYFAAIGLMIFKLKILGYVQEYGSWRIIVSHPFWIHTHSNCWILKNTQPLILMRSPPHCNIYLFNVTKLLRLFCWKPFKIFRAAGFKNTLEWSLYLNDMVPPMLSSMSTKLRWVV